MRRERERALELRHMGKEEEDGLFLRDKRAESRTAALNLQCQGCRELPRSTGYEKSFNRINDSGSQQESCGLRRFLFVKRGPGFITLPWRQNVQHLFCCLLRARREIPVQGNFSNLSKAAGGASGPLPRALARSAPGHPCSNTAGSTCESTRVHTD